MRAVVPARRSITPSLGSPFQSVTLHTDLGDIKLELHCDLVPKTCEVSSLLSSSSDSGLCACVTFRCALMHTWMIYLSWDNL